MPELFAEHALPRRVGELLLHWRTSSCCPLCQQDELSAQVSSSSGCCIPFLQSGMSDLALARPTCCLPCLQDVLSALVAHLGSCNLSEADAALDSLLALAKSQAGLQEHADALATSMIEWLEFFDTAQIHKVGCQLFHAACAHTATFQPDELAGYSGMLEQSQQPA